VKSAPPGLQKSPDATISTVASVPTSAPPKTPEGNAAPAPMRPVAPPPPAKANPTPLASGAPAINGSSGGILSPAAPRGGSSNNTPTPIPQSKGIDSQLKGNKPGTGNDGVPPVANTGKDKRENRIVQLGRSAPPGSTTPPPRRPASQGSAAQMMTSDQELMTRQKARASKVQTSPSPSSSIIPPKLNSRRETMRNKNSRDAP